MDCTQWVYHNTTILFDVFSAESGSIHLCLTYKLDNKSRVIITFNNQTVDYELLRGVKLSTQMDLLSQFLKTPMEFDSYALCMEKEGEEGVYITQEVSDIFYWGGELL